MVAFEKTYCKLMNGEATLTGGLFDPMMNKVVEYVINQVKVFEDCQELKNICADDYLDYITALLIYKERLEDFF